MPTRDKPRNLKDVSHLFLSRGERAWQPGGGVEAVLWLVPVGSLNNRAFIASGCAAAAAAKGLRVTLLEIGEGLPNVGYYFSLDPSEYAAPGVDPSRIVAGGTGAGLRFLSCSGIEALDPYDPESITSDSPHLLIIAFEAVIEHLMVEDIGRRWLTGHSGHPDALCAFGGTGAGIERRALFDSIRRRNREVFLLDLVSGGPSGVSGGAEENGGADETFSVPERLVSSWRRRNVPEDRFFDDIVSNILQVLSHRRRKVEGHASGR
jgi:hypothetical protein